MSRRNRLLSLLTVLMLLFPQFAFAEPGCQFSFAFHVVPDEQQPLMTAFADLLNVIHVDGTYAEAFDETQQEQVLDLHANFIFDKNPRTATDLHLYGCESLLSMQSQRLMGDANVLLTNRALVEFGAKMKNHMGIPLDLAALLVPFSTKNALQKMAASCSAVLFQSNGTRTIRKDDLLTLANTLSDLSIEDSYFQFWMTALGGPSGSDELLLDLIAQLPDWVEDSIDEAGLAITEKNGKQTWSVGSQTIARIDANSIHIDLESLPNDTVFQLNYEKKDASSETSLSLLFAQGEEIFIQISAVGTTCPTSLPFTEPISMDVQIAGLLWGEEPLHLTGQGQFIGESFELVFQAEGLIEKLAVTGTLSPLKAEQDLHFQPDPNGVNLFSLNDVTLKDFVKQVAKPLVTGGLSILSAFPASTCVMLMDVVEQGGMIDLLSGNASFSDEALSGEEKDGLDSEWEEENWEETYEEDDWDF